MEFTDEQLEQLRLALLKKVPKVILTKDDNGEILMHLPNCCHAVLLTPLELDPLQTLTNVKKCTCMRKLAA